ncbi:hypothetical protein RSSM_01422 [Rhodopirellula sallentina SM41]|uniref:Uncharacterized protein n=1 Tax=Rhodopirellula sallentina SM41 TaxID=1263870 RepID=M5U6S9_9BACT|nr:hypothetical protein RSSM_01422 [Rhodopirellula sallentina SM41]
MRTLAHAVHRDEFVVGRTRRSVRPLSRMKDVVLLFAADVFAG